MQTTSADLFSTVVGGVVGGVLTTLIWAILLSAFYYCRHWLIRRKLKDIFAEPGFRTGIEGFGVTIFNKSKIPVTIRNVRLFEQFQSKSLTLNYIGPTQDVSVHYLKNQKEEMNIRFVNHAQQESDERGFVILPPECGGKWVVSNIALNQNTLESIESIVVILSYADILGRTTVLSVKADHKTLKLIDEMYQSHKPELPRLSSMPTPK